jgi:hypothetical protein
MFLSAGEFNIASLLGGPLLKATSGDFPARRSLVVRDWGWRTDASPDGATASVTGRARRRAARVVAAQRTRRPSPTTSRSTNFRASSTSAWSIVRILRPPDSIDTAQFPDSCWSLFTTGEPARHRLWLGRPQPTRRALRRRCRIAE